MTQSNCRMLRITAFLFVFLLIAHHADGQVASRITGTVQDTTGAVIAGVTVTAKDTRKGTEQSTETNSVGRYAFPNLGSGEYVLTAEMSGFKQANTEPIRLDVNQTMEIESPWKSVR